ncbi:MAG: ribbon-helix-helix protein, CopG family [Chloroflexota bacterium]|jgi:predicted DNA-binding protein
MVRTQIQLTEEQSQTLRELAAREGISVAELIRRSVDRLIEELEQDEKWRRALSIVGRFDAGPEDVSENHDNYLVESYL